MSLCGLPKRYVKIIFEDDGESDNIIENMYKAYKLHTKIDF